MLGLGAESIIVPVRADKRTLSPAPRRLSFLCTLAPTAAVLYTFVRCSTSEALRTHTGHNEILAASEKATPQI